MSRPSFRQQGSGLVRLAIPNKGRIAGPVNELIEKSGLHLVNGGERRLITRTRDPNVEILFARPIDIPEYVAAGSPTSASPGGIWSWNGARRSSRSWTSR